MSNVQLKLVRKLAQKKFRNELKLFVAEGLRLCEEVPPAQVEFGFFTREFVADKRAAALIERLKFLQEVPSSTLEKIINYMARRNWNVKRTTETRPQTRTKKIPQRVETFRRGRFAAL